MTTTPKAYSAQGKIGDQTVSLQIVAPKAKLWDPAIYAPALPGVALAAVGLWIAHEFSAVRDRRKELRDLCDDLDSALKDATQAAADAWTKEAGAERKRAVKEAKRQIQILGIKATNLNRLSRRKLWFRTERRIDLIKEVATFRDIATGDPFDDLNREPSSQQGDLVYSEAARLQSEIGRQFAELYGHLAPAK